jgi:hypothetical protein
MLLLKKNENHVWSGLAARILSLVVDFHFPFRHPWARGGIKEIALRCFFGGF